MNTMFADSQTHLQKGFGIQPFESAVVPDIPPAILASPLMRRGGFDIFSGIADEAVKNSLLAEAFAQQEVMTESIVADEDPEEIRGGAPRRRFLSSAGGEITARILSFGMAARFSARSDCAVPATDRTLRHIFLLRENRRFSRNSPRYFGVRCRRYHLSGKSFRLGQIRRKIMSLSVPNARIIIKNPCRARRRRRRNFSRRRSNSRDVWRHRAARAVARCRRSNAHRFGFVLSSVLKVKK